MNSNELSYSEKKIFKALYHFKKNKKKVCLNILKEKFNDDLFLEGMRYYLIGLTYNQFGHFFYAIENLEQSIKLFEECQEEDFIVNPLSILALVYCNRREELKMAEVLDKLLLFKPKTALRKLQIQYANFSYLYLSKQFSKAQKIYRKLIKENLPEFKVYKPYFMILIFMFNVREKNYRKCYELMEDYSTLSGHMVKVNYSYNKALLDFIVNEKPLYIYAREFAEYPELHHQLEVIKALKSGDIDSATLFWGKLSKHNPDLYQENFQYKGEECLFTQGLRTCLPKSYFDCIDTKKLEELPTKLMKLDYILSFSEIPIPHTRLIELIYAEEVSEMAKTKLRRLIADYTKKTGNHVKSHQGAYKLIKQAA
jgi:tetratricopeptide (TPR) repeat protein